MSKVFFTFTVSTLFLFTSFGKKKLTVCPKSFTRTITCTFYFSDYGFTCRFIGFVSFLVNEDPRYIDLFYQHSPLLSVYVSLVTATFVSLGRPPLRIPHPFTSLWVNRSVCRVHLTSQRTSTTYTLLPRTSTVVSPVSCTVNFTF